MSQSLLVYCRGVCYNGFNIDLFVTNCFDSRCLSDRSIGRVTCFRKVLNTYINIILRRIHFKSRFKRISTSFKTKFNFVEAEILLYHC